MSIGKSNRSNLKESPVAGPRIRVEPANGSRRQLTGYMDMFRIIAYHSFFFYNSFFFVRDWAGSASEE